MTCPSCLKARAAAVATVRDAAARSPLGGRSRRRRSRRRAGGEGGEPAGSGAVVRPGGEVMQTFDGLENFVANIGTERDKATAWLWTAVDRPADQPRRCIGGGGRKIIDIPTDDMVREWRTWERRPTVSSPASRPPKPDSRSGRRSPGQADGRACSGRPRSSSSRTSGSGARTNRSTGPACPKETSSIWWWRSTPICRSKSGTQTSRRNGSESRRSTGIPRSGAAGPSRPPAPSVCPSDR